MKIMTILGTRPEIIRLSRVIARLETVSEHVLVHTGQNYDYELNQVFFDDLAVKAPDHYLGVDTSTLGTAVGGILVEIEKVLAAERPDAVLILGDTNSAISAYMARRMKIPVYHMEAGNRCFDRNVPEETNRKLVDHIADFNLVYTEHARRNLLAEGLHPRRILVTGSPMREVLQHHYPSIRQSGVLATLGLEPSRYFVASLHREENVDDHSVLAELLQALDVLARQHDLPVVVSTHPRTRKRLEAIGTERVSPLIRWLKPFGFHDYNQLQLQAACVLSDSGTIAEESAMLGFPAVTPRRSIERPEAMDTGAIMIAGTASDVIVDAVNFQLQHAARTEPFAIDDHVPVDYRIGNTSERVARLILGTAALSNPWDGIRVDGRAGRS